MSGTMSGAIPAAILAAFPWPVASGTDRLDPTAERPVRQAEVERLARTEGIAATARLRELLDDRDVGVRLAAERALLARRQPEALAGATRSVLSGIAQERAAGLELMRVARELTPAARAAVERSLADADPAVKLMALEALTNKDLRPALPAVTGALEDSSPAVRVAAVRLLASTRDRRAAVALLGRTADADRLVRREAIAALGAVGDERVVPALIRLCDAPFDEIRRAAITALAELRHPASVPALAAIARGRSMEQTARYAQWALGEIASPAAVAALVALFDAPAVTDETKEALLRAGSHAVPGLVAVLDRDGREPRAASIAAALLARIGDRRAVVPLVGLLRARNEATPAALRALARLAPPEALVALVSAATDPSEEIRRLVLDTLWAIGDDRAVVVLDAALGDPDPGVKRRAAALAGRFRAKSHRAAVANLLADSDRGVRNEAVRALGALGDAGVCQRLVAAASLRSSRAPIEETFDEASLAEALEATARGDCVDPLLAAARPARGTLRRALVRGLAAATSADPSGPALDFLATEVDGDPVSAEIAADALAGALGDDIAPKRLAPDAFYALPSPVRARLCPVLAATPVGRARLGDIVAEGREPEEVIAAAAWALAGAREPALRAALARASRQIHPAVADNASAALLSPSTPPPRWTTVRVQEPDGRPAVGRWLRFALPGGSLWARSGAAGLVRVRGLPAGNITVSAE